MTWKMGKCLLAASCDYRQTILSIKLLLTFLSTATFVELLEKINKNKFTTTKYYKIVGSRCGQNLGEIHS